MIRREFLKAVARKILTQEPNRYGWIPGHCAEEPSLITRYCASGSGEIKCLWPENFVAVRQLWTDCVAVATAVGLDFIGGYPSNSDMIFSGGRNIFGSKSKPGMYGRWAMQYLTEYGNLLRKKYLEYDLTKYTRNSVQYWDDKGIPKALLKIAKKTPLLKYTPVYSYEDVRDAIVAKHPCVLCMKMGADNSRRDRDGFMEPAGSWSHAWVAAGVDDTKRPGICLINSHGPRWSSGPKHLNQPGGSVWVDAKHIDKYLKRNRDSYALASCRQKKPYRLW